MNQNIIRQIDRRSVVRGFWDATKVAATVFLTVFLSITALNLLYLSAWSVGYSFLAFAPLLTLFAAGLPFAAGAILYGSSWTILDRRGIRVTSPIHVGVLAFVCLGVGAWIVGTATGPTYPSYTHYGAFVGGIAASSVAGLTKLGIIHRHDQ